MFNKFFKFLKGYVIIEVRGAEIERFINICVRRKLTISNIKHISDKTLTLHIRVGDFMKLRPIAYKTRVRIKILKKYGLYEVKNTYEKRYMLFVGAVLMIVFFAVTSQFIWVVKIDGAYNGDTDKLLEILEDNGIRPGFPKYKLPPISDIKQELINETNTISWAWVYLEGVCARVEIYEKRLKPQTVDKSKPCDIVAASDGFIITTDVLNGVRVAKNEAPVCAGDVIISGRVPVFKEGYPEEYMYVHAEGEARAVTYHEASAEQKLYKDTRIKTGRVKNNYSLEIFGKLFRLHLKDNIVYENYDIESFRRELKLPFFEYIGICLNEERIYEVDIYREPLSKEAAVAIACDRLEEQISGELLKAPEIQNKSLEWEDIDDETILVRLNMSFIEDIGTEMIINEE